MGVNDERDIEANLQIGPTDAGMVRLFVEGGGVELPMDFTPEEAVVISAETGVGPSIASGNQVCSPSWADLPMAPIKSSTHKTFNVS